MGKYLLLWRVRFADYVRRILPYDINGDGKDEVLVTSWEGVLAVLDSAGRVVWKSTPPTPVTVPAEAVTVVTQPEKLIVASFHRYVCAFSPSGRLCWKTEVDSWVHEIVPIQAEGETRLCIISRKGRVHVLSSDGDKVASCQLSENIRTPPVIGVADVNEDGAQELAVPLGRRVALVSAEGDVESLDAGYTVTGAYGFCDLLILYGEKLSLVTHQRLKTVLRTPVHRVLAGDFNGDLVYELLAVGESGLKVLSLSVPSEPKLTVERTLSLRVPRGDVIAADVDGDGVHELLVTSERASIVYDLTPRLQKVHECECYGARGAVSVGAVLGAGAGDVLVRIGREEIALLCCVPRVSLIGVPVMGHILRLGVVAPENARISIENATVRERPRSSTKLRGIEASVVEVVPRGAMRVRVKVGRQETVRQITVATDRSLSLQRPIYTTEIDEIQISEVADVRSNDKRFALRRVGNKLRVSAKAGIHAVELEVVERGRRKRVRVPVIVARSLQVELERPGVCLSEDVIGVSLRNESRTVLRVRVEGGEEAAFVADGSRLTELELGKLARRRVGVWFKVGIEEPREIVKVPLRFTYGPPDWREQRRLIVVLSLDVVNKDWLVETWERIKEALGEREALSKLSSDLALPLATLQSLIKKALAGTAT